MSVQRDFIWISTAPPKLEVIASEVARRRNLTVDGMKSQSRTRALVEARWEFWWRARQETSASYPKIARYMGDRDHATAIHGVLQHEALMAAGGAL